MANEINIYEPRYLAEAVRTAPPICTFLRDRFFSKVKTFPTKNVDIDIVKGNRKMAAFVHPMVGGEIVQNEGYETKSYAPPLINPATVTTADMFLQRLPGEDIYSGRTPADRAAEKLTEEYNKLNDMTTRREEWMAAQVLTTGQLKVKGKGVDEVIDFGFTNKINLEGTKQWGKSAADTMGNLREWKRQVSRNGFANANIYDAELSDSTSELVPVGVVSPGSFYTTTKAGVLNGCETHDGFIRFFSQRIPEADIQATVTLFWKGGGSGETGSVSIGQGLKRDASGAIAVRIGEGLDFDSANALTVRKETVMTSEDLLNEEETQQEIVDMENILKVFLMAFPEWLACIFMVVGLVVTALAAVRLGYGLVVAKTVYKWIVNAEEKFGAGAGAEKKAHVIAVLRGYTPDWLDWAINERTLDWIVQLVFDFTKKKLEDYMAKKSVETTTVARFGKAGEDKRND